MLSGQRIAPFWRRLLASLVNLMFGIVTGGGAVAAGYVTAGLERPVFDAVLRFGERMPRFVTGALWAASAGVGVLARKKRSPGLRVFGLRRVDAPTGGEVSIRSALMDEAFDLMWRTVTRPVFQSRTRREHERLSALRPQIEEIKRVHADDRQVQQRALMDLYRSNDVKPFRACSPNLLPSLLWSVLTGVLSWRGRTIRDRVTRTVVVVEAGGR